jgi:hypothetical protein
MVTILYTKGVNALFSYFTLFLLWVDPQSTYFPRDENRVSVSARSAEAYTATLLVMVNVMREGGRASPTHTSQG